MGEPVRVEKRTEMPATRVTLREIDEVKRNFIMANLCLSPEEVGGMFGKSPQWALQKVQEGKLEPVDDKAKRRQDGKGWQLSNGVRITASSVERYRRESKVDVGN